ncbi:MAG: MmgE/PrpD family protein [Chloroflexi bacterium]|nr:MmgE/PrpD family protein [Chloroflexota bacterium]
MSPSLTEQLAGFVTALRYGDLPPSVQERARALLLHGLAVGLVCHPLDPSRIARRVVAEAEPLAAGPRILVDGTRVTVGGAIFANAAMLQARNNEDTYHMVTHPGCVVIPVALAVGEATRASGHDVLSAVVAGYEVAARLADHAFPHSNRAGFRATGIYTALGAAAAAGRLLGLDRAQMAHALGIAASGAAGLLQGLGEGRLDWKFQAGQTGRAGYLAATLAAGGATGAHLALEGPAGFYRAFCRLDAPPDLVADLGRRWEFTHVISKPFPVATINQTPVRAILRLQREHALRPDDIERIVVTMAEVEIGYPGTQWRGPFEPGVQPPASIPYAIATALVHGHAGWSAQCATDHPLTLGLLERIEVRGAADRPLMTCALAVTTRDGRALAAEANEGEAYYFFDWERAAAAVRELQVETPLDLERLVAAVGRLEQAPTVDDVVEACLAPVGSDRPPSR